MCKFFKDLFTKEWTLDDKILCVTVGTLLGFVIGFLLSPVKQGINVFSSNGCNNSGNKSVSSISKGDRARKAKCEKKDKLENEENAEK